MVFSRLAKLMSHASVISLPLPVARPRMSAIEATGKVRPCLQAGGALRYAGQVLELGREIGVIQKVVLDRAVEDHHPDLLVGLQSVHDLLKLLDHFRAHHVALTKPVQIRMTRRSPAYWRVTIDNPPLTGSLLINAAPALLTISSWESAPPEQPIAPIIIPCSISGMPPRDAMIPSNASR
jgi:hypothetical protein